MKHHYWDMCGGMHEKEASRICGSSMIETRLIWTCYDDRTRRRHAFSRFTHIQWSHTSISFRRMSSDEPCLPKMDQDQSLLFNLVHGGMVHIQYVQISRRSVSEAMQMFQEVIQHASLLHCVPI